MNTAFACEGRKYERVAMALGLRSYNTYRVTLVYTIGRQLELWRGRKDHNMLTVTGKINFYFWCIPSVRFNLTDRTMVIVTYKI